MFKKMVLVGILLVAVLVLSGCGTYEADFKGDENQFSYGGFKVPKVGGPNNECGKEGFKTVGNLCFAVGDADRCKKFASPEDFAIVWKSKNVPKYSADFCVPSCLEFEKDSCGKKAVCYKLPDQSMNICSPFCTSDADCLPGLTSCKKIFGSQFCVPNDDLSKLPPPVVSLETQNSGNVLQTSFDEGEAIQLSVELDAHSNKITLVKVDLLTDSEDLVFTHSFTDFSFFKGKQEDMVSYVKPNNICPDCGWYFQGAVPLVAPLSPPDGINSEMFRVFLKGLKPGTRSITAKAEVWYQQSIEDPPVKHTVLYKFNGVEFAANQIPKAAVEIKCIPKNTCSGKCGVIDNGCGKVLQCPACMDNKKCVDNVCQIVVQAKSPEEQQLCQNVINQLDVEKGLIKGISDALSNQQFNKLQKLNAIVTAVKAWLASQQ